MKKIKVLCDADLLCRVAIHPKDRTGLFYTCKAIVEALSKSKDIDLTLCSFKYSANCFKKYLEYYPSLKKVKYFWLGDLRSKSLYYFQTKSFLVREEYKKTNNTLLKIYLKFLYLTFKLLRAFSKLIKKSEFSFKKQLEGFDIYQSLVYKIPKQVSNSSVKTAIVVHDVIPVKYPEFFIAKKKENPKKKFGGIFNSIQPETLIFTNSHYTKKDLLDVYPKFKKNKISVTQLAADKDKFFQKKNRSKKNSKDWKEIRKSLKKYKIPLDKPYFLSLGSLNPRKNLEFIVDCFIEFLKRNPKSDANLALAGPKGWKFDVLFKKLDKNKKYSDRIIVTGFVEDKDINNMYNGAFAFIYPSLYEGFGLPVLEAMQCGIPVITSNVSSLPEIAGDTCILVNPRKKRGLITALEKLYKNKSFREFLRKKSLKQAGKFDWGKTTQEMIKGYKNHSLKNSNKT